MSARGAARLNDKTLGTCSVHGPNIKGRIITGSGNIYINDRPTARLGDEVLAECGHRAKIITASGSEDSNAKTATARLNDKVKGPEYTGKIVTASTNVFLNPDTSVRS